MSSLLKRKHVLAALKGGAASQSYQDTIKADGAIAYWPLDDPSGTTALDKVGTRHGTISGGVTLNQAGVNGSKCMVFDGTTGKILTVATVPITPTTSFEWWFKTTVAGDLTYVGIPLAGSNDRILVGTPVNDQFDINIYHASVAQSSYPSVPGLPINLRDGAWHHIALVFSGTAVQIYVDGVSRTVLGLPMYQPLVNQTTVFQIGHHSDFVRWWNGSLQDIAIYNRALTPAEISSHYTKRLA